MRRWRSRYPYSIPVIFLLAGFLAGCGGSNSAAPDQTEAVQTVNPPSTLTPTPTPTPLASNPQVTPNPNSNLSATATPTPTPTAKPTATPTPTPLAYLITGPGSGSGPEVSTFDGTGAPLTNFFAYSSTFSGGVTVASCDLNGDGNQEIITGAGPGGGPNVRVFDLSGNLLSSFFAYSQTFTGGVFVACGDLYGDGRSEIITGPGSGSGPQVEVFDEQGDQLASFFAYSTGFSGGVRVAAGDIYGEGKAMILTAPGPGGGPQIQAFDTSGNSHLSFFAYSSTFMGGAYVASGDIYGSGSDVIITGPGQGGGPQVEVFDQNGNSLLSFFAYSTTFMGGVTVGAGDIYANGIDDILTAPGPGGGPQVQAFDNNGHSLLSFFSYSSTFTGGVFVGFTR